MWEMIQNVCTGIVGVEAFIMVWAFVSMYLDERRERKRKTNEPSTWTRECHITHDGSLCMHDDDWHGSCLDCPVKISYDDKLNNERLEKILKNTVEEIMKEK